MDKIAVSRMGGACIEDAFGMKARRERKFGGGSVLSYDYLLKLGDGLHDFVLAFGICGFVVKG